MVTFLKHAKTSEMALFHVCHFQGFCPVTLEFAEGVRRSMSYGLLKFGGGHRKVTWLRGPGKRHLRMANFRLKPWGEVPPDFTPPSPDFVFQLVFGVKPSHSKFGFKPLKPGRATGENVVFSLFWSFSELALFHVYIFLAFYCMATKVSRVVPCSMLFSFLKVEGHTAQVTWLTGLWTHRVGERISPPDYIPRFGDFVVHLPFGWNRRIPNLKSHC